MYVYIYIYIFENSKNVVTLSLGTDYLVYKVKKFHLYTVIKNNTQKYKTYFPT